MVSKSNPIPLILIIENYIFIKQNNNNLRKKKNVSRLEGVPMSASIDVYIYIKCVDTNFFK